MSTLSANSVESNLRLNGDFLTLTRQNPLSLPACQFNVAHQISGDETKVTVTDTGIIAFEPINRITTKDIVLSSGVHGNETAPIEICVDLIQNILLGKHAVAERVLFLIGNPPSMNISERFVEENMNRLFSGEHENPAVPSNQERVRANQLEKSVAEFFNAAKQTENERQRFHYDLHTAIRASKNDKFAVYPFRHGKPWVKEQLQFLLACGVNTILLSHSPTTTFSYYSSNEHGAHAFTVELGKVKPFGENDMASFQAVKQTLSRFISGQDLSLKLYDEHDFNVYEIYQTINREHEEFSLNFADDVPNFTDFPVGYELASDGGSAYVVGKEGEAIIFPNANVAIGQRALLTVIPTKI